MMEVVRQVDKANGYVYGQGPGGQDACMAAMMSTAVGADFDFFKYPCQICFIPVILNHLLAVVIA